MGESYTRAWTAKLSQLHEGDAPFRCALAETRIRRGICTRVGNVTYLSPRIYLSHRCETRENFYPPIGLPRSSSFGVDRRGAAWRGSVRFGSTRRGGMVVMVDLSPRFSSVPVNKARGSCFAFG